MFVLVKMMQRVGALTLHFVSYCSVTNVLESCLLVQAKHSAIIILLRTRGRFQPFIFISSEVAVQRFFGFGCWIRLNVWVSSQNAFIILRQCLSDSDNCDPKIPPGTSASHPALIAAVQDNACDSARCVRSVPERPEKPLSVQCDCEFDHLKKNDTAIIRRNTFLESCYRPWFAFKPSTKDTHAFQKRREETRRPKTRRALSLCLSSHTETLSRVQQVFYRRKHEPS